MDITALPQQQQNAIEEVFYAEPKGMRWVNFLRRVSPIPESSLVCIETTTARIYVWPAGGILRT